MWGVEELLDVKKSFMCFLYLCSWRKGVIRWTPECWDRIWASLSCGFFNFIHLLLVFVYENAEIIRN